MPQINAPPNHVAHILHRLVVGGGKCQRTGVISYQAEQRMLEYQETQKYTSVKVWRHLAEIVHRRVFLHTIQSFHFWSTCFYETLHISITHVFFCWWHF